MTDDTTRRDRLAAAMHEGLQADGLADGVDADDLGPAGEPSEGALVQAPRDVIGDQGEQFVGSVGVDGREVDNDLEVGPEAGESRSGHAIKLQHTVDNVKGLRELEKYVRREADNGRIDRQIANAIINKAETAALASPDSERPA